MTEALMAHPDLRHPFESKPINADSAATVLYGGKTIAISEIRDAEGLWIRASDLVQVNGFEIKPQGACFEDLCIPLSAHSDLVVSENGTDWIDLVAFAALLEQPLVADEQAGVWSFGEIPAKRGNLLSEGMAPDFEVVDREGKVVRMSDFKGKKALIITWSSW